MRKNINTEIIGNRVILVPYKEVHVLKYHNWMQSPELQELTASEPLTLKEEYEMQQKWQQDEDKCTFIVLDKEKYQSTNGDEASMIGDTNLFVSNESTVAEVEIMIAETDARGKHCGWEAMILMLRYGVDYLKIKIFVAKVKANNEPSIRMFQKLGFKETSRSKVFNEVSMDVSVTDDWKSWIDNEAKGSYMKERR